MLCDVDDANYSTHEYLPFNCSGVGGRQRSLDAWHSGGAWIQILQQIIQHLHDRDQLHHSQNILPYHANPNIYKAVPQQWNNQGQNPTTIWWWFWQASQCIMNVICQYNFTNYMQKVTQIIIQTVSKKHTAPKKASDIAQTMKCSTHHDRTDHIQNKTMWHQMQNMHHRILQLQHHQNKAEKDWLNYTTDT